jgi:hypothetical protein
MREKSGTTIWSPRDHNKLEHHTWCCLRENELHTKRMTLKPVTSKEWHHQLSRLESLFEKKDRKHEEECDEHEKPSLKITTTTCERNQKHEKNYDEHKLRVVVGDHGAPDHSHYRFK